MEKGNNENHILTYKVACGVLGTILLLLLTIVGFFFSSWMNLIDRANDKILKNTESMSVDLMQVRLKITELESKMLTNESVRSITREEIYKYHVSHPNEK